MSNWPKVKMMHEIVCQAENHLPEWGRWGGLPEPGHCDDDTYFTSRAARDLGLGRTTLYRKLEKYGITFERE